MLKKNSFYCVLCLKNINIDNCLEENKYTHTQNVIKIHKI